MNKAELMSKLDHPNIIKFDECFQYNIHVRIVSEYFEVFYFKMSLFLIQGLAYFKFIVA